MGEKALDIKPIIDSIACCGLICELCHLAANCSGCRADTNSCGKHLSETGCFQRSCCMAQQIRGCWECRNFPCDADMYGRGHNPKVKAFARCIREDGPERFIRCILRNRQKGLDVRYQGDYDLEAEAEILALIRNGPQDTQR